MSIEPKLHRLPVMVDNEDHAMIWDAIRLHHATQDVRGFRSPAQDGKALVAICLDWIQAEHARIRGSKGG